MKSMLTLVVVGQLYAGEPPTVSILSFEMTDMTSCHEVADELGVQGVARKYWGQYRAVDADEVFYTGEHILAVDLACVSTRTLPK